jgi:hypothetical protein
VNLNQLVYFAAHACPDLIATARTCFKDRHILCNASLVSLDNQSAPADVFNESAPGIFFAPLADVTH